MATKPCIINSPEKGAVNCVPFQLPSSSETSVKSILVTFAVKDVPPLLEPATETFLFIASLSEIKPLEFAHSVIGTTALKLYRFVAVLSPSIVTGKRN